MTCKKPKSGVVAAKKWQQLTTKNPVTLATRKQSRSSMGVWNERAPKTQGRLDERQQPNNRELPEPMRRETALIGEY